MPNRLRFRCVSVNNRLTGNNHQVHANRAVVADVLFTMVQGEGMNHWVQSAGANNNGSFAIRTNDPVAAVAFQVGRDYMFTIDDWPGDEDVLPAEDERDADGALIIPGMPHPSGVNAKTRKRIAAYRGNDRIPAHQSESDVLLWLQTGLIGPDLAQRYANERARLVGMEDFPVIVERIDEIRALAQRPQRQIGGISDAIEAFDDERARYNDEVNKTREAAEQALQRIDAIGRDMWGS